jgi:hypothetical protein
MNILFKSFSAKIISYTTYVLGLALFILVPFFGNSQIQTLGIPFQGVAKDYAGNFVNERDIYVQLELLAKDQPAIILIDEVHQTKTDEWGLFSILIGNGRYIGGKYRQLSQIDWSTGNYLLRIKMAIAPEAPLPNWDYKQHLITLGSTAFGIVPYAMYSFAAGGVDVQFSTKLDLKLNSTDTSSMLSFYTKKTVTAALQDSLQYKLSILDTTKMLAPYLKSIATLDKKQLDSILKTTLRLSDSGKKYITLSQLNEKTFDTLSISNRIEDRMKYTDTLYLSNRINKTYQYADTLTLSDRIDKRMKYTDTMHLSNQIGLRELMSNKSINIATVADYTDEMYPSVKATKDYIDNQVSAIGIPDASITDVKIAAGIQASKVGLANVTNHAQLYQFNGLTAQIQDFGTPSNAGLAPNWTAIGSTHTLNLPMANTSSVTAGLISKTEFDQFNTAYTTSLNALTTTGNSGLATLNGQSINVPNYTIAGLSGLVNPNFILAGPSSGTAGIAQYRAIVSADIPNHAANTTGNANTATLLQNSRSINSVAFDGSADILIKASTTNKLTFSTGGLGASATENFDGSASKNISYNTIGAAPMIGSTLISTLGTITSGIWNGAVIAETVGGAGMVTGLLKADGAGLVSAASAINDYQVPLSFSTPLANTANTISMLQANTSNAGYLSNTDWNLFNGKINATEKAVANGVATLNALGKIPTSQIPAISFSSGYVVSNETQMLALSAAVVGSIAIRTDNSKNYVLSDSDPALLTNWLELLMPASVSSVNGYTTGSIVLTSSDLSEGSNLYFTNARVRTAVDGFLIGEGVINYNASNGKISSSQSGINTNGYLSSIDWNTFNNKLSSFGTQTANTFYAAPNGNTGAPGFRTIVANDIPVLNQSTTGNAATANLLLTARNINGVSFDGSADITIPSNTANAITFNNSGTGAVSTTSFDGSLPIHISYNSIGALPTIGANTITTLGTVSTGTWNANVIGSNHGGAGAITGLLKANGSGVVAAAIVGTDFEVPLSFTAPITRTTNSISIQTATSGNSGILSAADWLVFNNKQATIAAGAGISLTGGNTIQIGQSIATTSISTNTISATSINTGSMIASSTITAAGDISAKRFKLTMPATTTAAATTNLDLSTGNVFTINLGLNVATLNLTNPVLGTYLIKFVQDATGTRDVTFPSSWKWAGGAAPNLTNTAGKLDIVTLIYDGVTYYATIVQNF